jgi:hypothetical protein
MTNFDSAIKRHHVQHQPATSSVCGHGDLIAEFCRSDQRIVLAENFANVQYYSLLVLQIKLQMFAISGQSCI